MNPNPLLSLQPLYDALEDTISANYVLGTSTEVFWHDDLIREPYVANTHRDSAAAISLIVYDHLLTFSLEVSGLPRTPLQDSHLERRLGAFGGNYVIVFACVCKLNLCATALVGPL